MLLRKPHSPRRTLELLKTPTKRKNDSTDEIASSSGYNVKKKVAKKNIFNSDDYLPDECLTTSPRSPTPPPKKKPFQPPLKKGIGKSTVKPSTTKPSQKTTSNTDNPVPLANQIEMERLQVLKDLSQTLAKEEKKESKQDEDDDDRHWTNTLYRKSKRVENSILKEQTIAVVNNIFSYSVMNERHPAVEAMFPTMNHRNMHYNMSVHAPVHQFPPVYYTVPPYHSQPQQSVRPQQQGNQMQQPPHPPMTPAPTPPISQSMTQGIAANHPSSGHQNYSAATAAQGYMPSTTDYPFGLTQSPMKGQSVICHSVNTYVGRQQPSPNTLDFTQL